MKRRIYVTGMKCEGCAGHVTDKLNSVEGIKVLNVNLKDKYALVEDDRENSVDLLSKAINNGKYTFERVENESK